MTPERWQHIEELFHSALEREANARAGFLATAASVMANCSSRSRRCCPRWKSRRLHRRSAAADCFVNCCRVRRRGGAESCDRRAAHRTPDQPL